MVTVATNSTVLQDRLTLEKRWNSIYAKRFMGSRHFCPCCSYLLLAHIRLDTIYWHCRHCYQEMPLMEGSRKILSLIDYETLIQQLLVSKTIPDPLLILNNDRDYYPNQYQTVGRVFDCKVPSA
jgi:hypothetical protein